MILIVAAAILGAALGLFMRPRLLAFAVALSLSGATHLVIGFVSTLYGKKPGYEALARTLDAISSQGAYGVWPVITSAGAGTILAALAWSAARQESTDGFWFPGTDDGDRRRGVRSMAIVEDRAIHAEAKDRLDQILRR